ncbi:hypothetical protein IWX92DRAFT_195016 [Phyllosticta citricarpa]
MRVGINKLGSWGILHFFTFVFLPSSSFAFLSFSSLPFPFLSLPFLPFPFSFFTTILSYTAGWLAHPHPRLYLHALSVLPLHR